ARSDLATRSMSRSEPVLLYLDREACIDRAAEAGHLNLPVQCGRHPGGNAASYRAECPVVIVLKPSDLHIDVPAHGLEGVRTSDISDVHRADDSRSLQAPGNTGYVDITANRVNAAEIVTDRTRNLNLELD